MEPLDWPLQHKPSANEHTKNIITIRTKLVCILKTKVCCDYDTIKHIDVMETKGQWKESKPQLKQKLKLIFKVISNSRVLPSYNHLWLSKIVE
jgi:hypothetical protein